MNIICYELISSVYVLYSYYITFLSSKSLYKWLSILVYVMSCTTLYEWLSILFLVFVMHIFVGMTIYIILGFRHAHFFTNDFPYYFWFFSCTSLYKLLSIGFRHAHLCTNDYFVPNFFPMRFYKTGIFFMFPCFFRWDKQLR